MTVGVRRGGGHRRQRSTEQRAATVKMVDPARGRALIRYEDTGSQGWVRLGRIVERTST
jgi:hypothetical protein